MKFKKVIAGLAIGGLLVGAALTARPLASWFTEKSCQSYVDENLNNIIKDLENAGAVGIQDFAPFPTVDIQSLESDIGNYWYNENRITLRPAKIPGRFASNAAVNCFSDNTNALRRVLDHEIGHFYIHALNRSLTDEHCYNCSWQDYEFYSEYEYIGKDLISEGIAEYFSRKINGTETGRECTDEIWKTYSPLDTEMSDEVYGDRYYGCSHRLVKPVIDAYGVEGIKRLLVNPPKTQADIADIPFYQNRILAELAENHQFGY